MYEQEGSLDDKVALSNQYFKQICQETDLEHIFVAWTGGKDSTVVLYLWKLFLESRADYNKYRPQALTIDTGLKFDQVLDFRAKIEQDWNVEAFVARPDLDLSTYPIAQDPIQCCHDLKIKPLKKKIKELKGQALLTGLRRDEHSSREQRFWKEQREDPAYIQVNPILHWTEMDVWSFHLAEEILYCPLYDQGYRSLGCKPCTFPTKGEERSGRNREKEQYLEHLKSLGYF